MAFISSAPRDKGLLSGNPASHILKDTAASYAPEVQPQGQSVVIRLSEYTDVWGIRNIAWSLIVNRCIAHGPVYDASDSKHELIALSVKHPRALPDGNNVRTLTGDRHYVAVLEVLLLPCTT